MTTVPPHPHLPTGTTVTDLGAEVSLPAAWSARWRERPEVPVVGDADGSWLTGADLLRRTEQVAGRFAGAGLRPGDRVLVSAGASADLVVAHCAALRAGLVVVPLSTAATPRELDVVLTDTSPVVALLETPELAETAARIDPDLRVVGVDVDLADGPPPPLDAVGSGDPALLPSTSGTTGRPKGAVLSHGNLLAGAEALRLAWRWTAEDRLVLSLPLFHVHGLAAGLHGTLLVGASVLLHVGFDPEAVLRDAEGGATMFFGVPTMYTRLADAPGARRLAALRLCVSGSAPMSAALHRRVRERCGQDVLERYGMTETLMLVSNPHDGERRPGSVGLPLPGVELRLGAGDEIEVRGPNVFAGYLDRPDANAEAFTPDGWFRTGDVGAVADDGYVSIVGRAKELIITGGYNVYPREVEDVLRGHPDVGDVAVVGTPSEEWGETVTAYVEPAGASEVGALDVEALSAWAAARLAPYKRPRLVHVVVALPRNRMGKVVRGDLHPPGG